MKNFNYFLLFTILIFSGCDKENAPDCLKKTGEISTKTIELSPFKYLTINDLFKVKLIPDTENKLVIRGGKNMIPKVEITEVDTTLSIENLNTCNWTRSYQKVIELDIHFTEIKDITVLGQVELYSTDTIKAHYLTLLINTKVSKVNLIIDSYIFNLQIWNATGEFYVSGKTNYFWLHNDKYAYVYAQNYDARMVHAENNSTGDIYIKVREELQAWIKSYGDIIYDGNPDITYKEITSTGNLVQKNK
jgi:hypothetical protein